MPKRLGRTRIDHMGLYLCVLVGLAIIAVIILLPIAHGVAHDYLTDTIARIMAVIMLIGSVIALVCAASGTRFRPYADLRDLYHTQAWALIPTIVALVVFAVGVIGSGRVVDRIEVAVLIAATTIGLVFKAWNFQHEAHRLTIELVERVDAKKGSW